MLFRIVTRREERAGQEPEEAKHEGQKAHDKNTALQIAPIRSRDDVSDPCSRAAPTNGAADRYTGGGERA